MESSQFQNQCICDISALCLRKQLSMSTESREDESELLYLLSISVSKDQLIKVYIYSDGADYCCAKKQYRYERWDFDNLSLLKEELIRTLQMCIERFAADPDGACQQL